MSNERPLSEKQEVSAARPGFRLTGQRGFHVTFENGWTVSVQFGPGNYCANKSREIGRDEADCGKKGSPDAETAVWGPDGDLLDIGTGDTVQGWRSPAQVLELLQFAANGGKPSAGRVDEDPMVRCPSCKGDFYHRGGCEYGFGASSQPGDAK